MNRNMSQSFPQARKCITFAIYGLLLILITLFAFSRIELWRGSRSWESTKATLEANGLTVDWAEAIPTPVPDEQNLALARVLTDCYRNTAPNTAVGDWQAEPVFNELASEAGQVAQDLYAPHQPSTVEDHFGFPLSEAELLEVFGDAHSERLKELSQVIEPYRAALNELREECSIRPESYLPGDYTISSSCPIPNYKIVRPIAQLLTADAILALHEGNSALALENCHALYRIADLNPQTPFMINVMIKNVVLRSFIAEVLWYGISQDAFDEDQLRAIIDLCQQNDQIQALGRTFDMEMLFSISSVQDFNNSPEITSANFGSSGTPLFLNGKLVCKTFMHRALWYLTPAEGWNFQMSLRYIQFASKYRSAFDQNQGTIDLHKINQMAEELEALKTEGSFFDGLLLIGMPAYQTVSKVAVDAQRRIDLIEIAATLSLAAKQGTPRPETIISGWEQLPTDPANQQPYTYKSTARGFTISSLRAGSAEPLSLTWEPKNP
ncbi:Unannotated [Lentimonas sp. CC19]|nr:Unannotated [Lentimonas sp. CC10]CAA6693981.1 Unannotated [Lentimonas sp. CC19]CAA7070251.1 Unannotated [Lentimonas sp. CC11]